MVAPVWEQLGLSANQAGAADDEPPGAERALGDLGDPLWRVVVQLLPARLRDALDRAADALVLADADRIAGAVLLERGDRLVASLRVFLCIGGWLGVVGDAVSEVDA